MKTFKIKQPTKNLTKEEWIGNKDVPLVRLTVEIPKPTYHEFKIKVLKEDKTISNTIREFVEQYIRS